MYCFVRSVYFMPVEFINFILQIIQFEFTVYTYYYDLVELDFPKKEKIRDFRTLSLTSGPSEAAGRRVQSDAGSGNHGLGPAVQSLRRLKRPVSCTGGITVQVVSLAYRYVTVLLSA